MHKAPRGSEISKTDIGALEQNGPTRTCLVRRPHMARHGAPDRMMPQGRKWQTGRSNMHKALEQSQICKTDTGTLEQNSPTRAPPVGRPRTVRHGVPDRMMPQGGKWKTGCSKVQKAPRLSQLSMKTDTGALERNGSTRTCPVGQPRTA